MSESPLLQEAHDGPSAATDSSPVPRRRFVLELHLGADSREDMVSALRGISKAMERGEYPSTVISGGYNSGFVHLWCEDDAITHDTYEAANAAWLAKANE